MKNHEQMIDPYRLISEEAYAVYLDIDPIYVIECNGEYRLGGCFETGYMSLEELDKQLISIGKAIEEAGEGEEE